MFSLEPGSVLRCQLLVERRVDAGRDCSAIPIAWGPRVDDRSYERQVSTDCTRAIEGYCKCSVLFTAVAQTSHAATESIKSTAEQFSHRNAGMPDSIPLRGEWRLLLDPRRRRPIHPMDQQAVIGYWRS
jgi:hypothetical protein